MSVWMQPDDAGAAVGGDVPTDVRGEIKRDAPLAKLVWFKSGGAAD